MTTGYEKGVRASTDSAAADRYVETRSAELIGRYAATAQHLAGIHRKIARLEEVRAEAERQLFHAIGTDHAVGEVSEEDLVILRQALSELMPLPFGSRWNSALPISSGACASRARYFHKFFPNGPRPNSWIGTRRDGDESSVARPGIAVVYVLYDAANEPIYVGSTGNLRQRLAAHHNGPLPWANYMAVGCDDREHAYELEEELLRTRMPPLNKKASR